jgi:hypothetical protein
MVQLGGVSTSVGHQELSRRAIVAVQRAVVVMTYVDVTVVDNLRPATTVLLGRYPVNPRKEALHLPSRHVRLAGKGAGGNDRPD